jgi:hypothetical protein
LLYIFIAVGSLGISIPLTKYYGGIGCAVGTATALTLGQIIIMNIYYRSKQGLDVIAFWREIIKMSIAPLIICGLSYIALQNYSVTSWSSFAIASILFSVIYLTTFFRFSMNSSERDLFVKPLKRIINR